MSQKLSAVLGFAILLRVDRVGPGIGHSYCRRGYDARLSFHGRSSLSQSDPQLEARTPRTSVFSLITRNEFSIFRTVNSHLHIIPALRHCLFASRTRRLRSHITIASTKHRTIRFIRLVLNSQLAWLGRWPISNDSLG